MSLYTFSQYLAHMSIIQRRTGKDYHNYIEAQLAEHPELIDKKQSWEAWKRENI